MRKKKTSKSFVHLVKVEKHNSERVLIGLYDISLVDDGNVLRLPFPKIT